MNIRNLFFGLYLGLTSFGLFGMFSKKDPKAEAASKEVGTFCQNLRKTLWQARSLTLPEARSSQARDVFVSDAEAMREDCDMREKALLRQKEISGNDLKKSKEYLVKGDLELSGFVSNLNQRFELLTKASKLPRENKESDYVGSKEVENFCGQLGKRLSEVNSLMFIKSLSNASLFRSQTEEREALVEEMLYYRNICNARKQEILSQEERSGYDLEQLRKNLFLGDQAMEKGIAKSRLSERIELLIQADKPSGN